jgi:hypothetical protein
VVAALTAPLWLGLYEPTVFYALNRRFAAVPDIVWTLFSLFGTGWAVYAATAPTLWRAPRVIAAWLCAAPLAGVLTRLGKMAADNPRPLEVLGPQDIHVVGEPLYIAAMPSGRGLTGRGRAPASRRDGRGLHLQRGYDRPRGGGTSMHGEQVHTPTDAEVQRCQTPKRERLRGVRFTTWRSTWSRSSTGGPPAT